MYVVLGQERFTLLLCPEVVPTRMLGCGRAMVTTTTAAATGCAVFLPLFNGIACSDEKRRKERKGKEFFIPFVSSTKISSVMGKSNDI